jgi:hypothetical protein
MSQSEPGDNEIAQTGKPEAQTPPATLAADNDSPRPRLRRRNSSIETDLLIGGAFSPNPILQASSPIEEYREYVKSRITHSFKKASRLRLIHNILQIIILVGAALVSISLGFPHAPSWFPPLISGVVTIATVIANYYKFGERGRDLYRSAEIMQQEYNWFKSERGPYKNMDEAEAYELLRDKMDALKHEQFQLTFAFEDQKESQK